MRIFWLKLIALALPFIVLGLIEGILQFYDYGFNPDLFIEDKKCQACWVLNPDVSKRYFNNPVHATIGNHEPFKKIKDKNTYRMFVLGESTTVGYPYLHNGSFHRWLQYRLQFTFPEKHIEIINLALTAVNSYTIRDFADELKPYKPDAVLIYAGHNEYYGALGVSSSSFLGSNHNIVNLSIKIKRLKIVQLLISLTNSFSSKAANENVTLMQHMSQKNKISYKSNVYYAGIEQFSVNLDYTLKSLSSIHVPVYISTIVSNEKDLPPFISDDKNGVMSATMKFNEGKDAYLKGNYLKAKSKYIEAKELDLLRFRAPDSINVIIKDVSKRYPNVTVVDTDKKFEHHSPHGILGNELLLEHVHPNLTGYALMSDAFYKAIKDTKQIMELWKHIIPFDSLLKEMPITKVDSLHGVYEIMILREQWPFYEKMPPDTSKIKSIEEKLAGALSVRQISWGMAMLQLLKYYKDNGLLKEALKISEALALDNPNNYEALNQAAILSHRTNQIHKAIFYWQKSFAINNEFSVAKKLFIELLKMNRPEDALKYILYVDQNNKENFSYKDLYEMTQKISNLKNKLTGNTSDVFILNQMCKLYLSMANTSAAKLCIVEAFQFDVNNKTTKELQHQMDLINRSNN